MIRLGKYHLCVLDLVTDNGTLSSTKIWRHVAYGVITYKFVGLIDPDVEWMVAYAAIIISDAGFMAFLKRRYPHVDTDQPQDNSGGAGGADPELRPARPRRGVRGDAAPGRAGRPGHGLHPAVRGGQNQDEGGE